MTSPARFRSRHGHQASHVVGAASLALSLLIFEGGASAQARDPEPPPSTSGSGAVPSGASGAVRIPAQTTPEANVAVTPPKIVHFENAPYPPEAEKLGLEANVILRLDIDKDGKVTGVAVTEPAGHGFDEAATEAAKKFLFEPARRGATPIPARILYRYGFTLRTATPEATAEPAPPADSLRGIVRPTATFRSQARRSKSKARRASANRRRRGPTAAGNSAVFPRANIA